MNVYLAGPDVFLPDPLARASALKAVCARHGLTGVFPLDPVADEPAEWADLPAPRRIALQNEAHIRRSAALIANLTPFRGPSADIGTVFEVGFARALGLPVFAWSNDPRPFRERTLAWLADAVRHDPEGQVRDASGMLVEDFGCVDNLMLDAAVVASGGLVVLGDGWGPGANPGAGDPYADLTAFARCVACVATTLSVGPGAGDAGR
jgi:nucleoside 2-deoxyribosyltransferase